MRHFPAIVYLSLIRTMLSSIDLERLIMEKRREIEKEKTVLGLTPHSNVEDSDKENRQGGENRVHFTELSERGRDVSPIDKSPSSAVETPSDDSEIPPGLERYIRRCTGLPVMLKAGEYSPNNPLIRGERQSGDVLLGLGEYERRRNTLRKLRQQQYREYLDQQAKIKQEAKEKAERERREREERERAREEEERERERRKLEEERVVESPVRRASLNYGHTPIGSNNAYVKKMDACVQVGLGLARAAGAALRPLSVAVQTEPPDCAPAPLDVHHGKSRLTPAERELSPRSAPDRDDFGAARGRAKRHSHGGEIEAAKAYTPSILDAEAIERRNIRAEQEAAARREYYQRELKNQILEQQRIREERKARERLLEQAELRRLERQLRALRPSLHPPQERAERAERVERAEREEREEREAREQEASRALSSSVASFDVEGRLRRGLRGQGRGQARGQAQAESSEQMRRVEAKWLVPAVQRSVVSEGRSSSVLTQLGAIRRQLQLEQLRLDSIDH